MTDSPPAPSHSRNRALDGATARLLKLLFYLGLGDTPVDIATTAVALNCDINTVHQAAHRLREMGLYIKTLPPGPYNQWTGGADSYLLDADSLDLAHFYLELITGEL